MADGRGGRRLHRAHLRALRRLGLALGLGLGLGLGLANPNVLFAALFEARVPAKRAAVAERLLSMPLIADQQWAAGEELGLGLGLGLGSSCCPCHSSRTGSGQPARG